MKNEVALAAETPVLDKNTVTVALDQNTTKIVRRKGVETVKPVIHHMSFSDSTSMALTSENVSNFIIAKLFQYQFAQKIQGNKSRFDVSLPINLTILVNGTERVSGIKFSTNAKTLETLLNKYPTMVDMVFNPQQMGIGTTKAEILKLANGVTSLLAKAIDPAKEVKELLAVNLDKIEVAEEIEIVE